MTAPRYVVRLANGQSGRIAHVWDTRHDESVSVYSARASRDFKRRAQDAADSMNASDFRVALNSACDDLLPYPESRDYQRDMED